MGVLGPWMEPQTLQLSAAPGTHVLACPSWETEDHEKEKASLRPCRGPEERREGAWGPREVMREAVCTPSLQGQHPGKSKSQSKLPDRAPATAPQTCIPKRRWRIWPSLGVLDTLSYLGKSSVGALNSEQGLGAAVRGVPA